MARRYGRRSLSKRRRFQILERDNWTCQYCGRFAPEVVLEVDHILPVIVGGSDDPSNLITACRDCNGSKSDKLDVVRDRWAEAQYDQMFDAIDREIIDLRNAQRELAREFAEKFKKGISFRGYSPYATVRPTVLALSGFAAFHIDPKDHGELLKQILGSTKSASSEPGVPRHARTMSIDITVEAYMRAIQLVLTRKEQLELAELIVRRLREAAEREGEPWP